MNVKKRKRARQGEAIRHIAKPSHASSSSIRHTAFESNAGKATGSSVILNLDPLQSLSASTVVTVPFLNPEIPHDALPTFEVPHGKAFESEFPFDPGFIEEIAALEPDPKRREKYTSVRKCTLSHSTPTHSDHIGRPNKDVVAI